MNLFLLGWSPRGPVEVDRAHRAVRDLVPRLPFLDAERTEAWLAPSARAGLVWVAHRPEETGSARYVHAELDRVALFAGRPFRWTGEFEADGRSTLDASIYLDHPDTWARSLDGRCAAASYDDRSGALLLYLDPLGAYPVYSAETADTLWISNNAELLRALLGLHSMDPLVLASLMSSGWSLTGDPLWSGVRRLPRGGLNTYLPGGAGRRHELLPVERIASMLGAGFDPESAAAVITASVGALADWPGRPNILQLSGGRDSRLLLAASVASGPAFDGVITSGSPDSPDVRIAERLCETANQAHRRVEYDPEGALFEATRRTARLLMLMTSGTACLADAGGFFQRPREGPLPVWHNGAAGELARAHYGSGEGLDRDGLVDRLYGTITGFRADGPGILGRLTRGRDRAALHSGVLSRDGARLVTEHLRDWVDDQLEAGVAIADVPDVFYLLKRMATWAAPANGWLEFGKGDPASPLWGLRILAHEFGGSRAERARGAFHAHVLERLSPALAAVPYEDELPEDTTPDRPLISIAGTIRDVVLSDASHAAWDVLSRPRVERILRLDPLGLDHPTREYWWKPAVWRLATVFLGSAREPTHADPARDAVQAGLPGTVR